MLRHRRRRQSGPHAQRRRLVAGRRHDDAARAPFRPQIAFEKLVDFPPPLADQRHHRHIRSRVADQHAQRHALADARPGKDAQPLSKSAGQHAVDGAQTGRQRRIDARSRDGVGRTSFQRRAGSQRKRRPPIDRAASSIDHASQQGGSHRDRARRFDESHASAVTDAFERPPGIHQRQIIAKTDHFPGDARRARRQDFHLSADRRRKIGDSRHRPFPAHDAPRHPGWIRSF